MREGNKLITESKRIKKSTQMGIIKNKTNANGRPITWSPRGDNSKISFDTAVNVQAQGVRLNILSTYIRRYFSNNIYTNAESKEN